MITRCLTPILSFLFIIIFINTACAQVGIGTTTPQVSSVLDLTAADKGFLPPRVALTSTNAAGNTVASPVTGLLIFNTATAGSGSTAVTPGYYYFNGTRWIKIASESSSLVKPEIITANATNVTSASATFSANIISDGGNAITERGFYWGFASGPNSASGTKVIDGATGTGSYTYDFSGGPNTTIYVRAYATTENGITVFGNEISFTTLTTGYTGQAGGTVIYDKGVFTNGWRYLEAAPADQSAGAPWGCSGTLIGGTGSAIGTGKANTTSILAGCATAGIAARLCSTYSFGGYTDWFLPSVQEAALMCQTLGTGSTYYWTSTEVNSTLAVSREVITAGVPSKTTNLAVRAIRSY